MPDEPTPTAPDAPLSGDLRAVHGEALFFVAQLAAPDARRAARAVEHVLAAPPPISANLTETRARLTRAVLERLAAPADTDARPRPHAARLVSERLPVALSALAPSDRVLLGLRLVRNASAAETARLVGADEAQVVRREEELMDRLRSDLLRGAASYESGLMSDHLSGSGLRAAVERALRSDLQAPPAALAPPAPPAPSDAPRQAAKTRPPARGWVMAGYLAAALAITLLTVFVVTQRRARPPETDALTLAMRQARDVEPVVETEDPGRAERFAEDHSGFSFRLPRFEGYRLRGTTLHELAPGVSVPAFRYRGADGGSVTLFTFPYALLDRSASRLTLPPDVRAHLEAEGRFDLHEMGSTGAVMWRDRDDLFVAVTTGSAADLRDRIAP